jgi:hypothetical protein
MAITSNNTLQVDRINIKLTPFLERAAPLLERGFSLIPCEPRGKKPIAGLGVMSKTKDPAIIQSWAEAYPDANVGVCADEEIVILDLDDVSALPEWIHKNIHTYSVQSSPGKVHYYFRRRCFDGHFESFGNMELGFGSLRARNEYVIGAGSVHPKGHVYTVLDDLPVAELSMDIRGPLSDLAEKVKREVQRVTVEWDGVSKFEEGQRHYFLRSQAGKLWDGEISEEELFEKLCALNQTYCVPPKDEGVVQGLVNWVVTKEPNRPAPSVRIGSSEMAKAEAEKFRSVTAGELRARQIPERQVLMAEGAAVLLFEKSINQIFSWRGIGKTMFALGMANSLAGGGDILGFSVKHPVPVLYVDGELPAAQLKERADQIIHADVIEKVSFLSPDLINLPRRINLLDGDGASLRNEIERIGAKVVIIDSQATLMTGDALKPEFQDARSALLLDLRLGGICVIELHHAGKSREQRGSSRNDDLLDIQMDLQQVEGWEPGDGLQFRLTYAKVRHGAQFKQGLTVCMEDGKFIARPAEIEVAAREMFNAGKSTRKVAEELGISQSTASRIRRQMQKAKRDAFNSKWGNKNGASQG